MADTLCGRFPFSLSCRARDYFDLGAALRKISEELCHGRVVAVLEGGYTVKEGGRAESIRHCLGAFGQGLAGLTVYNRKAV